MHKYLLAAEQLHQEQAQIEGNVHGLHPGRVLFSAATALASAEIRGKPFSPEQIDRLPPVVKRNAMRMILARAAQLQ